MGSLAVRNAVLLRLVVASAWMGSAGLHAQEPNIYPYREVDGKALKAYVFMPQKDVPLRPAVLLFHGGAWQLGDATWMFDRAKEFVRMGMVAIAIDYRLAVKGLSPIDGVEDACAAFTWARAQAR